MARKALIEKNKRSKMLISRYADLRKELLAVIKDKNTSQVDRQRAYEQLEKLPKRSSAVLYRDRCALTGRPRGYMRMFKLSRLAFRRLALLGRLPGVKKTSW